MIRVLVVASSAVVRAGLESILSRDPSIVVVGSDDVGSAPTVAEEIAAHEPHVVLVEGGAVDDELLSVVADDYAPEVVAPAVVILADETDTSRVPALVHGGVRALLPRDAGVAEILAAVAAAAAGLVSMPADWLARLLPRPAAARVLARGTALETRELTPRELEVLRMIAEGLANKQIAGRLGISEHTVKFHVAAVFAKLRASTRAEAVMLGARRGMIVL